MRLSDIISFRRDLLFQGAVQIGWLETDPERATKAAEHFVFHGPAYHGGKKGSSDEDGAYQAVDTASFAKNIWQHVTNKRQKDDPIMLAVAGYGTGKSHFALTMGKMLAEPNSKIAQRIMANLSTADQRIGAEVEALLRTSGQPYLVIAVNGMQDFDLSNEIIRQVLLRLTEQGLSTAPLEDLRPRFQRAQNFVEAFFDALKQEFERAFGPACAKEEIIDRLKKQDENAFIAVNRIYEGKIGDSLRAVAHESLETFLRVARQVYCGPDKPFAGIIIFFDEFGRYLEFAVRKPHVAGAGGLQQLFEAVQANSDAILLVCFIQYELQAYASRIAPEAREALERYLARYDSARKLRLSTNLETIFANLIEKRDPRTIDLHVKHMVKAQSPEVLIGKLRHWFHDLHNHALWNDAEKFKKIIQEGCWPLHPFATWLLYCLSAGGKYLQQRSAMYFLDELLERYQGEDIAYRGWSIPAVALCTAAMIEEFLASERFHPRGGIARAFDSALAKQGRSLSDVEKKQMKAVLLAAKLGVRASSEKDYLEAIAMLAGSLPEVTAAEVNKLVKDRGILRWNPAAAYYDIIGDAVSMQEFQEYLTEQARRLKAEQRSLIFAHKLKDWLKIDRIETDFGPAHQVHSAEWHFAVRFANISLLENQIKAALTDWQKALAVDECRGQLIYCYVGPESDLPRVRDKAVEGLHKAAKQLGIQISDGAPVVVVLINDQDGALGQYLAEYATVSEKMDGAEAEKFANFIVEQKGVLIQEINKHFRALEKEHHIVAACEKRIHGSDLKSILHNLFEVIYPELIPFPFDGFHTARGNAATDCRLFTAELFSSNLNQGWIAVRNTREKNRAVNVLHKNWQVFGADGAIQRKPGNIKVRNLINAVDVSLTAKKPINPGEALRMACRPPYGCNVASAGMILAVFVAARKDQLQFKRNGKHIFVEEWLSSALHKNFLDLSVLDETAIHLVAADPLQKWQALLNEWDAEKSYQGQIDYLPRADKLNTEQLVPDNLYYRWELLRKRANEAVKELQSWKLAVQEQEGLIEKASERKEAGRLAKCADELKKLSEKMNANKACWTNEQFSLVEKLRSMAEQSTKVFFTEWLSKQIVTDPTELGSFRNRLTDIKQSLVAIGLNEEARQLQAHVTEAAAGIERLIKVNVIIEQVKTFIQSQRIVDGTRANEICACLKAIPDLKETLNEAVGKLALPQINDALSKLKELEERCNAQLQVYEARKQSLCNGGIHCIEQVTRNAQELRSLCTICDGMTQELEGFQRMLQFLTAVESDYRYLDSFQQGNEELKAAHAQLVARARATHADNGLLPWNVEETYAVLLKEIALKREAAAADWMLKSVPAVEQIVAMDGTLVQRLRNILQSPPVTLNQSQQRTVKEALTACIQRLDAMEVDGLLLRFKDLSNQAQAEFLQRAQQLVARRSH